MPTKEDILQGNHIEIGHGTVCVDLIGGIMFFLMFLFIFFGLIYTNW